MQNKQWRIVGLGDYKNYYSYFTYGILEGAIRCGAWFRPISFIGQSLEEIESQINWFKPHLIFAHMIFNGDGKPHPRLQLFDMLRRFRKNGIRIAYHMGDARTTPRYPENISDLVDIALINHGMLKEFSAIWKIPCYHWPYSCLYQKDIGPYDNRYHADIVFTGALSDEDNINHGERTRLMNKLKEKYSVKIFPDPILGNTRLQTAEVAASANIVLGVGMREEIPLYLDVRPFQYIGAGALFFHNRSEVMLKFFLDGTHYVSYKKDDSESIFRAYLNLSEYRKDYIRKAGFDFCQKHHSTKERVQFVIDLLEGKEIKPIYLKDIS